MYDIVAQRLRLFLAKKDITCKKLSAMIFMSEATLKGKLNGTRTLDLNTIISIAIRLEDLSVEWLLRGEGDMFKSSSGVSILSSSVPIFTGETSFIYSMYKEEREELLKLRREPDITKDGRKIEIYANIGNMDDLNSVLYYGAAGIGLLRSEFQYLGRENYPRENELFLAYKKIAETMGEKLTVIRTADLGADKQAEYLNIPDETNPIMGNRGIRLCLDRKRMFKAQLRAIFRASAYGNLALMYPMISSEEEMDEIEEIIREVKIGLDEKGIPYKHIKTGIMIETPAAVMISRELARRVDFLSLGTNDLSQYTLAMDRQNPLLRKKYNDHHPAVLRMIQMVIEAGHAENRRVCICGELAADTALTEEFLRMGVDCLSVVPACILPVRKALRQVDLSVADKGV